MSNNKENKLREMLSEINGNVIKVNEMSFKQTPFFDFKLSNSENEKTIVFNSKAEAVETIFKCVLNTKKNLIDDRIKSILSEKNIEHNSSFILELVTS